MYGVEKIKIGVGYFYIKKNLSSCIKVNLIEYNNCDINFWLICYYFSEENVIYFLL